MPRLRVFEDQNGETYAKQLNDKEVQGWLDMNPGHKLVR